jgi:hypothetical protein
MDDLDRRLLAAHDADDQTALVGLYTLAADAVSDLDIACFYLTHAYIHALEQNHPDADTLRARLKAYGREE